MRSVECGIGRVLMVLLLLLPVSCVHTSDILKQGTPVSIPGSDIKMAGLLYTPDDDADIRPAVLVLHGWLEDGENGAGSVGIVAWHLAREGYVSLALCMRGWPDTGGEDDCGGRQPQDVVDAVAWLSRQKGVDPYRIGIIGFSQGGQVALLAAARTPKIKAVVAFFPVTDILRWKQTTQDTGVKEGYIPRRCEPGSDMFQRSPIRVACRIEAPTLLIHGDRDQRVPMDQSLTMAQTMLDCDKKAQLYLVKGGGHRLVKGHKGWIEAWNLTKTFFREHLKEKNPS